MNKKHLVQGLVLAAVLLGQTNEAHAEGFFAKLIHKHECKSTYLERQKYDDHTAGQYDCTNYDKKRSKHEKEMKDIQDSVDKDFPKSKKRPPKGGLFGLFRDAFK